MDWNHNQIVTEQKIRELLESYFDGDTTLEEEKTLRDYFSPGTHVPPELQYARDLFTFFHASAKETMSAPVAPSEARERVAPTGSQKSHRFQRRHIYYAVASTIALLVVTGYLLFTPVSVKEETQIVYCYVNGVPVTDLQVAKQYAVEALELLTESLQKPIKHLDHLKALQHSIEN